VVVSIVGGFAVLVAGIWMKKARAENFIQMTEGYIYKPKDYTRQQKIHQGKIKKKNIRLADLLKELNLKVV
jgi:hypothetical protein